MGACFARSLSGSARHLQCSLVPILLGREVTAGYIPTNHDKMEGQNSSKN